MPSIRGIRQLQIRRRSSLIDVASLFEGGTYKGGWIDGTDNSRMKQTSGGTGDVVDGDPVGWYNNKAGNSGVWTETTALPTFRVVGGKGLLRFAAAGGRLLADSNIDPWGDGMTEYTYILVMNQATNRWIFKSEPGAAQMSVYNAAGAEMAFTQDSGVEYKTSPFNNTNSVWSFTGTSGSHTMRRNGTIMNTSTAAIPTISSKTWQVGDNFTDMTMDLVHLFFINRQLDNTTLNLLSLQLGADLGVSW